MFSHPEEYEELRASAYDTTIDVSQVAWAWSGEFHRIRNAMYTRGDVVADLVSSTVQEDSDLYERTAKPVLMEWNGEGSSVILKGSFDNWTAEWPLSRSVGRNGRYGLKLLLCPGEYTYKFKVDLEWTIASRQPQKVDASGYTNNVLVVQ